MVLGGCCGCSLLGEALYVYIVIPGGEEEEDCGRAFGLDCPPRVSIPPSRTWLAHLREAFFFSISFVSMFGPIGRITVVCWYKAWAHIMPK